MEGQVWLMGVLLSIVGVVTSSASARPQLVYNSDGTPRLEIINNRGILNGRMGWQTPEGKSVWIQYPLNSQGSVPWTPTEYTYSVSSAGAATRNAYNVDERINAYQVSSDSATRSAYNVDERIIHLNKPSEHPFQYQQQRLRSDRRNRRINTQITNINSDQSTVSGQNVNKDNELYVPVMEKFLEPVSDKIHGPVFEKLPENDADKIHGPVFEKTPSLAPGMVHSPVFEMFPSLESDISYGPVMKKFPSSFFYKSRGPTESPIEDQNSTDGEDIPVTESLFENYVINELESSDYVDKDNQVEDTTELGPLVRLSSRGRPQISIKIPEKQMSENRKQSIQSRPSNSPVPSLLIDPSLRQTNTRRPSTTVNREDRFRASRPGLTNQQKRVNPEIRRKTATGNTITRRLNLQEEDSNRGVARRPPSLLRINNRYSKVRVE